jgi:tetratricopeptide (TPR) repeat protein
LRDPSAHEAAKDLLDEALALGAEEQAVRLGLARVYNAEGVSLGERGDHHRALFALKRAGDLDPAWAGPWVNRGAILERLGQVAQAQREYRRALRIEPKNPVALYNLADSLRRQGAQGESERLFRRLLEIAPGYPGGEHGLRRLLDRGPGGEGDHLGHP